MLATIGRHATLFADYMSTQRMCRREDTYDIARREAK